MLVNKRCRDCLTVRPLFVSAVLCTNLLSIGYMTAFGVFFVEIVDTFQTTSSLASVIMAVQNGVSCFSGRSSRALSFTSLMVRGVELFTLFCR